MAKTSSESATTPKPRHRASYSRDKQTGGWNIRVAGPEANKFAGRVVPVTRNNSTETTNEMLKTLLWSGPDKDMNGKETGQIAALYSFDARPKDEVVDEIPF